MANARRLTFALLIALLAIALPGECVGQALQAAVRRTADSAISAQLQALYGGWSWRLLWQGDSSASARADTLLAWLDRAGDDGLDPADYGGPGLRALLGGVSDSARADADVRFSETFLRFGHDLAVGRVSPSLVDSLWDGVPQAPNLIAALSRAIERGDLSAALRNLRPPDWRYTALRGALLRYRAVAARGGWPVIVSGPDLRIGDRGARVSALRERLAATEGLKPAPDSVFDTVVDQLLRRYQTRQGLSPDGVAGQATLAALNVSVDDRIATIEMNLERWRWAPRALASRYILVNIPAYLLELHDTGTTVTFRAIVGRADWPTPITNAWMDGITFGPEWNVPRSIALQEVVPQEREHPGYLRRAGFRVLHLATGTAVDLDAIDWSTVDSTSFPFRLVQGAGPANPLGAIRFDVRDPFNVAIHDTPQRALFGDRVRIFSHGCVRVDQAAALAARLLPDWSLPEVREAQSGPAGRRVPLGRRVRVLLTYQTAWVDADGGVAFRDDVYGWDGELQRALVRAAELSSATAEVGSPH